MNWAIITFLVPLFGLYQIVRGYFLGWLPSEKGFYKFWDWKTTAWVKER